MPVTVPRGVTLPKSVLRALLVVTTWAKDSGYVVRILRERPGAGA